MNYTKLPLLEFVSSSAQTSSFNDTLIIAGQHLLYSNYVLFSYLFELGLSPNNLFLIGKSYSTDPAVVKLFKDKGSYVHDYKYTNKSAFDEQYELAIANFLKSVKANADFSKIKKIIVIDDGGFLIAEINSDREFNNYTIVAVEQTTSGYDKLSKLNLKYPVINVARSWVKLRYESPFIARTLTEQLYKNVKKTKMLVRKVLIIGGGAIGNNMYNLLRNTFDVNIFDIKEAKSHIQRSIYKNALNKYDLIIGCTGKKSISYIDYSKLKRNVILMSASSSDREFDAFHLRKNRENNEDIHATFNTNGIILVNAGYPINFVGQEIELKENIQLTRALIFSAIMQAIKLNKEIGILDLDTEAQDKISTKYKELIKNL